MSSHGYQMGGTVGFLKTLSRIVSETCPSAVYLAWEGGGSSKRRKLFAEYKLNRRPERLNRFYDDDIPDSDENRKHQIISLLQMTKYTPACQVYVADCEGDDTVAYLCRGPFKDQNKIIVSSDRDLFQLLDDKTKLYSLHKKTFVDQASVLKEFRVTTKNFALAKALCGDSSDNIPGIKGLGFKTVAKLFPFLGTEQEILLQDVFDYCNAHLEESKIYQRVIDNADDVRRNWKLVYLDGSMLSALQQANVDQVLANFSPHIDKMGLIKQLVKEGIGDFDVEGFAYAFHGIDGLEYRTTKVTK